ncbi:MAG TPA: sporulation YhaL family protein [Virgibacillus sp.]|nr:sporulation YhaL family protein [Virgibacillus sp.]
MLDLAPWWIWIVIIFMCFSGYMAFRAMRAERKLEDYYIEREGDVYMKRIEKERQLRHRQQ